MKIDKTIFEDLADNPAAEAAADARAEADVRDGRLIGNAAMTRWFKSWRTAKRLPKPIAGD